MLVGGRCSGWSRAEAHTVAYARAYFFIGLVTILGGMTVVLHLVSLLIIVPAAFCANLLFVRLFPRKSWKRETDRGWLAGGTGFLMAWVGTMAWINEAGEPLEILRRFGSWGSAAYFVGIPVFFSNLGVLVGYLPPRKIPPSERDSGLPPLSTP